MDPQKSLALNPIIALNTFIAFRYALNLFNAIISIIYYVVVNIVYPILAIVYAAGQEEDDHACRPKDAYRTIT